MKKYFKMALMGILSVVLANTAFAIDIYVNDATGVNDYASGRGETDAMPFKTLSYAISRSNGIIGGNNATFHVAPGTYTDVYGIGVNQTVRGAGAGETVLIGPSNREMITNGGDSHGSKIYDCTVMSPTSADYTFWGGAFYNCYIVGCNGTMGACMFTNCTVAGNKGAMYAYNVSNSGCLFYGNANTNINQETEDPLFVDMEGGDLRLRAGSPYLTTPRKGAYTGEGEVGYVVRVLIDGAGSIEIDGAAKNSAFLNENSTPTLSQAASSPRNLVKWLDEDGNELSTESSYTLPALTANRTLTAVFEKQTVDVGPEAAFKTIQEAIDAANTLPGDTIHVAPGTYGAISVSKANLTIVSTGSADDTIIDGEATRRCVSGSQSAWPTLVGFKLTGGKESEAAAVRYASLEDCVITDCHSSGRYGVGKYATFTRCLIYGNSAASNYSVSESCDFTDCTVVANNSAIGTTAVWQGNLKNTIVVGNYNATGEECGATDISSSVNSFVKGDAKIVSAALEDFRLRVGSPCLGATPEENIGWYKGPGVEGFVVTASATVGAGAVSPVAAFVTAGGNATFTAADMPGRAFDHWELGGETVDTTATYTMSEIAADAELTAVYAKATIYVDATRPDDSGDGLSAGTAKRTLQSGISAALNGETISVAPGTYAPITAENRTLTIVASGTRDETIIDGNNTARCATFTESVTNVVLRGFTLQNGNSGSTYGGGARGGRLENCVIENCRASNGGGAYHSTLVGCLVQNNCATETNGGGLYDCTATATRITGNRIANNATWSVWLNGSGVSSCRCTNCIIDHNTFSAMYLTSQGAAYACALYNCTVVDNTAPTNGGYTGVYAYVGAKTANTIVYNNTGSTSANNYFSSSEGNNLVDVDPLFVDAASGDYRLQKTSPARDQGETGVINEATDFAGNDRVFGIAVDIGAYEYAPVVQMTSARVFEVAGGSSVNETLTANGGVTPYTWSWSGDGSYAFFEEKASSYAVASVEKQLSHQTGYQTAIEEPLPFAFPFGDTTYTSVYVNAGGWLSFGNALYTYESDYSLRDGARINVFPGYFRADGASDKAVFKSETADSVTFRWQVGTRNGTMQTFSATLGKDGSVRLSYGDLSEVDIGREKLYYPGVSLGVDKANYPLQGLFVKPYSNHNDIVFYRAALPAGLTLSGEGVITGTPTVGGSYAAQVTIRDANGDESEDEAILVKVATTYDIVYDANGGTGTMANTTLGYEEVGALRTNTFTNGTSRFLGWSLTAGGAIAYKDGESVSRLSKTHGAQVRLYAVWQLVVATGATLPASTVGSAYNQALSTAAGVGEKTWEVPTELMEKHNFTSFDPNGGTILYTGVSGTIEYTLPFEFPFYDKVITTVGVNGYGYLTPGTTHTNYPNTDYSIKQSPFICPFFLYVEEPYRYTRVYVESSSEYVTFRWMNSASANSILEVSATLGKDGSIRFSYGPNCCNKSSTAMICISKGDGSENILRERVTQASELADKSDRIYYTAASVLPEGITLAADGTLLGTCNQIGNYHFFVRATDESGAEAGKWMDLRVKADYTLAFDKNADDATGTMTSVPLENPALAKHTLAANGFTRANCDFAGWTTNATGAVVYADQAEVENLTTENGSTVTLYAVWARHTFDVNFVGNEEGVSNLPETWKAPVGISGNLPTTRPLKSLYIFRGWNTQADGKGTTYQPGDATTFGLAKDASMTLYAMWEYVGEYTLKFDVNCGGLIADPDPIQVAVGDTIVLPDYTPVRAGFLFNHWVVKGGDGTIYRPGREFSSNMQKGEELTLEGVWGTKVGDSGSWNDTLGNQWAWETTNGVLSITGVKPVAGATSLDIPLSILNTPVSSVKTGAVPVYSAGNWFYYSLSTVGGNKVARLTRVVKPLGNTDVVLPASVTEGSSVYPVTALLSSADLFMEDKSITSVDIPGSIETIPSWCFGDCTALTNAVMHTGTKTIASAAFRYNKFAQPLEIPESCTSIAGDAFEYGFGSLKFDDDGYKFADTAKRILFRMSDTVETIPDRVEILLTQACLRNKAETIVIPDTVTLIGSDVFQDCSNLKEVVFLNEGSLNCASWFYQTPGIKKLTLIGGEAQTVSGSWPSTVTTLEFLTTPPTWNIAAKFSHATKVIYPIALESDWETVIAANPSIAFHANTDEVRKMTVGAAGALTLADLGIELPNATSKYAAKVVGLPKGLTLKLAQDKNSKVWTGTISGTPTEAINILNTCAYVTITETAGKTKTETMYPLWLDVAPSPVRSYEVKSEVSLDLLTSISPNVTAVAGLPAGLKFAAKDVLNKDKSVAQPKGTVYGAPTKPGLYTVKITETVGKVKTITTERWQITDSANIGVLASIAWPSSSVKENRVITMPQGLILNSTLEIPVGAKVAVSGLPAGLKFDAKTGKLTGVATKAGNFVATFKTTMNGATVVENIAIKVEAAPEYLATIYQGYIADVATNLVGIVDFTSTATGKLSGKAMIDGVACTLTGNGFDVIDDDAADASLVTKFGKIAGVGAITLAADGASIEIDIDGDGTTDYIVELWPNVFKDKTSSSAFKTEFTGLFGKVKPMVKYDHGTDPEFLDEGESLTLTLDATGKVTIAGIFNDASKPGAIYKASASAMLLTPVVHGDRIEGTVVISFPPKANKFPGLHTVKAPIFRD